MSGTRDEDVVVDYQTMDGTATTANADYVSTSGTVTIPFNSTSATVSVVVNGDTKYESDETFQVWLTSVQHASTGDDIGEGTIENDDTPPLISIGSRSVDEGQAGPIPLVLTVSLDHETDQTVTAHYETADNTATTANLDYDAASGTVTIRPRPCRPRSPCSSTAIPSSRATNRST